MNNDGNGISLFHYSPPRPHPPFASFHAIIVVVIVDGVLAITTPIVTTQHHDANNLCNMFLPYVCGCCCCSPYASNNINIKKQDKERRKK